jgi:hypothetical protein
MNRLAPKHTTKSTRLNMKGLLEKGHREKGRRFKDKEPEPAGIAG